MTRAARSSSAAAVSRSAVHPPFGTEGQALHAMIDGVEAGEIQVADILP
jgi:hypothetical protein